MAKLVLVGPRVESYRAFPQSPTYSKKAYPVISGNSGSMVTPYQYVEIPDPPITPQPFLVVHDPLDAEIARRLPFHMDPASLQVMETTMDALTTRLWDMDPISAFVEENCKSDVLLQQQVGMSAARQWKFVFINKADDAKFTAWWTNLRKEHLIRVVSEEDDFVPVIAWLKETLDPERVSWSYIAPSNGRRFLDVFIRDVDEAMMFILRWSGETIQCNMLHRDALSI